MSLLKVNLIVYEYATPTQLNIRIEFIPLLPFIGKYVLEYTTITCLPSPRKYKENMLLFQLLTSSFLII